MLNHILFSLKLCVVSLNRKCQCLVVLHYHALAHVDKAKRGCLRGDHEGVARGREAQEIGVGFVDSDGEPQMAIVQPAKHQARQAQSGDQPWREQHVVGVQPNARQPEQHGLQEAPHAGQEIGDTSCRRLGPHLRATAKRNT